MLVLILSNTSYRFSSLSSLKCFFYLFWFSSQWNHFTTTGILIMEKYENYARKHLKASVLWQKYSEKLAQMTTPPCLPYLWAAMATDLFSLLVLGYFFPTCLEIEAARALINGLKFSLLHCKGLPGVYLHVSQENIACWCLQKSYWQLCALEKGVQLPLFQSTRVSLGKLLPTIRKQKT